MFVKDVLVPNPLIVGPETSVQEFCMKVLDSNQTTAVVVAEDGRMLGMVSVHDVFDRIVPHYVDLKGHLAEVVRDDYFDEKFDEMRHVAVRDLMNEDIHTLAPEDSVLKAIALFSSAHHKTAPIVDAAGKFLGTITRRSVLSRVTGKTS